MCPTRPISRGKGHIRFCKMAAEKIVKIAEEKVLEGGKPRVTEREVSATIEETKKEKSKKSKSRGTEKTRKMNYDNGVITLITRSRNLPPMWFKALR
jgi:hypothetical protein